MSDAPASDQPLRRTPLYAQHVALGAKMVPFAGYEMPVQYPLGILKEHLHTRSAAGLFDVSHMGQAFLIGPSITRQPPPRWRPWCRPTSRALKPGQQRYTQLLNETGGIIDDLMVTRSASEEDDGRLFLVVNASRKEVDYAHIAARLPAGVILLPAPERALIALQGPAAAAIMGKLSDIAAGLGFMSAANGRVGGFDCHISRSGYTGEDGFEISVADGRRRRWPNCCWHRRAFADRPRRARLAAPGGGPLPLRPRHRRDDQPDRGRSRLVDAEAPPQRGRLPRRRAHPGRAGERTQARSASASSRKAARRRARVPRSWLCSATRSAPSRRAASGPASTVP